MATFYFFYPDYDYPIKTYALTIAGHADWKEHGSDLACAAISTLAYTLAQNVKDMKVKGMLKVDPDITFDDGDVTITASPIEEYDHDTRILFEYIQRGFQMLEANFPENVSEDK